MWFYCTTLYCIFTLFIIVYRPDTRGRVAPEGGGPINRYIHIVPPLSTTMMSKKLFGARGADGIRVFACTVSITLASRYWSCTSTCLELDVYYTVRS